jgi:hypothetical protein
MKVLVLSLVVLAAMSASAMEPNQQVDMIMQQPLVQQPSLLGCTVTRDAAGVPQTTIADGDYAALQTQETAAATTRISQLVAVYVGAGSDTTSATVVATKLVNAKMAQEFRNVYVASVTAALVANP